MTSRARPVSLSFLMAFALGCGGVTPLAVDGSAERGGSGAAASDGGAAGSGGAAGGVAGSGGAGLGGHGGSPGSGGAGGAGVCNVACTTARVCCGGACVNVDNDPMNCGTCGTLCTGTKNLCSNGACVQPPCETTTVCTATSFCCGNACCTPGQLCCESEGPIPAPFPTCFTPTADQKTCPQGCAPLCISDRNQKKNIAPVDGATILDKVGRLPISTWTYLKEPADVRHLGPMAQDFRAAFGLGDDDRTYYAVDAQGVALAAIQELRREMTAQRTRIETLERENRDLARQLRRIGTRGR